jgi:hypothetical protein
MSNNPGTFLDAFFTKPICLSQLVSTGSVAETLLATMSGAGTISGAWYTPYTGSTPSTGSNSVTLGMNIYDSNGNSLGLLATATLNNGAPMLAKKRYPLAVNQLGLENYSDGYSVTVFSTLSGTATLPAGIWEIVV